jgi:5-methylcytosine-specific restriction protein A
MGRLCEYPGCPRVVKEGYYCREHKARDKRPSPSRRGYGRQWAKVRERFLAANPACAICGAPARQVHHIHPVRAGGGNEPENLLPMCSACHNRITHGGKGSKS